MKEKFRISLPSGNVFVVDSRDVSGVVNFKEIHEHIKDMNEQEIEGFVSAQAFIGYYKNFLPSGTYSYKLNAILKCSRHSKDVKSEQHVIDAASGVLVIADLVYFKEIIEAYDVNYGLTKSFNPSTAYERKLSKYMRSENELAFNQIVATNNIKYEFDGPGEYFLKQDTFRLIQYRERKSIAKNENKDSSRKELCNELYNELPKYFKSKGEEKINCYNEMIDKFFNLYESGYRSRQLSDISSALEINLKSRDVNIKTATVVVVDKTEEKNENSKVKKWWKFW